MFIALDYFDASINRVTAWVTGVRNMQKALLFALLLPNEKLKTLQDKGDFSRLLAMNEELKFYPFADVWQEFCRRSDVPEDESWIDAVEQYEKEVQSKRK